MSAQKRASASPSSNQPNQPKRPRDSRIKQQRSRLTEEDVRRVVREEVESALAKHYQRCALLFSRREENDHFVSEISPSTLQKEAVEHEKMDCHYLGRGPNAKSMANEDTRDLKLQFRNKVSLPVYTGEKLKGKGGASLVVALIDAKTGQVVSSGPESSIKLDFVVLEGDFNEDDEDNWIREEFEKRIVKEREGKRPLLIGDLQVTLKEGFGQMGELTFTDNSSWIRSKKFRIGLQMASNNCGTTRIREAKTDAFPVKEHRGKSCKKSYPPKSDDQVWRLVKIGKDGKSHQKLHEVGIDKVEDFLLQLFTDHNKLREILGTSIITKNWEILVEHAKTCKTNWRLYSYYSDGMNHGVVFNPCGQLIGLIKDGESFATRRLSAQDKERGDAFVQKAHDNMSDVREFNGETFSDSMQMNCSSSFTPQFNGGHIENVTSVQRNLDPQIYYTRDGPEDPQENVGFTDEGNSGTRLPTLPKRLNSQEDAMLWQTVEDLIPEPSAGTNVQPLAQVNWSPSSLLNVGLGDFNKEWLKEMGEDFNFGNSD